MKLAGILTATSCALILFAACNKSSNDNDDNYNNLSAKGKLLVDGKWQLKASTGTTTYMGKDTTVDLYAQMEDCDKDDFVLFMSNGNSTQDENTNKCAKDDQIESATWYLLDNDTRIALIDSNPDTFDLEVTPAEFKLKWTGLNSSGAPIYRVATFKNIK